MKNYKFLIPTERIMLANIDYLAVSEDAIESVPVADTYDRYGQKCGHCDAGDYFHLHTQEACDVANAALNDDCEPGDEDFLEKFKPSKWTTVSAYEDGLAFNAILKKFGAKSEHATLEQQSVAAVQYHDGHNFRTIILDDSAGNILDYELLDDDELEAELNEAIEQKEYCGEGGGFVNYESEKYNITQSNWQGDFEAYQISLKHELEVAKQEE